MVGDSLHLVQAAEETQVRGVRAILPFNDTRILFCTYSRLLLFDGRSFTPFAPDLWRFLREKQLSNAVMLPDGAIALSTYRGGVVIIDHDGNIKTVLDKRSGLQDDNIKAVFCDRQGLLWLALEYGISQVHVTSPFSFFAESLGIAGSCQDIKRYRDRLYVGTGLGLYYLKPRGEQQAAASFEPIDGIKTQVWSLFTDSTVLLAGTNDGVYQVDGVDASLIETSWERVFTLKQSGKDSNLIYVGLEDGLALLRRQKNGWRDAGRIAGIPNIQIRTIVEEADGTIWLGTGTDVVFRGDLVKDDKGQSQHTFKRFDANHGFPMYTKFVVRPYSEPGKVQNVSIQLPEQSFLIPRWVLRWRVRACGFLGFLKIRMDKL
jgi:hypothetical protein